MGHLNDKHIAEEESKRIANLLEVEKAKIKEEVLLMLEEERLKAKIEQDALRAQMMCQVAESEERERMIHEEERMKAKIEQDALRAQMMCQVAESEERERMIHEEERMKAKIEQDALREQMMCQVAQKEAEKIEAGKEVNRILDDLRTQVSQLHLERNMTHISGVSATIYGDFDEIPDSDSPEEFDSTPHLEISDNTEQTCNTGVREMHSGIDHVADGDGDGDGDGEGDWVNRTSNQSISEVSVIEDTKPLVPLYSESPPRHSTRNQHLIGDSSELTPRFGSLIEASSNYSDLGTSEDRRTYDR